MILKKIILSLVILVALLCFGIWAYLMTSKPKYSGNCKVEHLKNEVEVYFDTYGIPHIFAQNDSDAMTALGYVHAQERLFQMELISRIAAGRLSELFGEPMVNIDKFFLTLGIDKNSDQLLQELDTTSVAYQMTLAYLDGVNQYVHQGKTPVEYRILGLKKHEFSVKDILNVYGYMSFSFAMAQRTDPLVSALQQKLGNDYIQQLGLQIPKDYTFNRTYTENEAVTLSKSAAALWENSPVTSFIGSNSWVISGEKTKTGKVIFENDPHIMFSQPATWFQAHIKTPQTETYGFYLALTPFPLLSHNHQLAYGLTMFENDDIDLYMEKLNPENPKQYLVGETYQDFKENDYTIKVKDAEDIHFTVRENHRGPVLNGVVPEIKTENPVTMYWVYLHRPSHLLDLTYKMSRAQNLEQFSLALPLLHAPGLNIMYGDAQGNIGWWATAHLYTRPNNAPTKQLLDGTLSANDSIIYHPFSENPQAVNPAWHYVYSCNNQPDSLRSKRMVPGYYLPRDRAKRVVELLESKNDWTQTEVENMVNDNSSGISTELIKMMIAELKPELLNETEQKALQIIKNWKGNATVDEVGISIYNQWTYEFCKAMLQDEMGEPIFKEFINTHLAKRITEPLIKGEYPIWSDDITTQNHKESIPEILALTYHTTIEKLKNNFGNDPAQWQWKKIVQVEHKHPFGEIKLLRPLFNVGPFATNGTNEVINNQIFDWSDNAHFLIKGGPSTRRIIDFSDVENARAIVPTGNSGNFMSKHYSDQAQLYLQGKYIPMLLNENTIKKEGRKLVLK